MNKERTFMRPPRRIRRGIQVLLYCGPVAHGVPLKRDDTTIVSTQNVRKPLNAYQVLLEGQNRFGLGLLVASLSSRKTKRKSTSRCRSGVQPCNNISRSPLSNLRSAHACYCCQATIDKTSIHRVGEWAVQQPGN
ncbi:uncharacterized protein BT62DRAFT_77614 [Guyanagaster necrorhizus]|uniref:Uncharacterized protein n=1 Tax=Guyanagaster necrorhizus TaxID=856835 RepID=A0A9P7VTZ7_9AGAR|nr:uncharacterized protein BT62DRAFT_77614 [Guyanagaster necrorhizus MCA 3950]KAG7447358.1 hypothetical protein BT62DRAFT_77614 [Guyanagaster necrorhizus MCA 3950]